LKKERAAFVDGVVATGYERLLGTSLFDIIEQFADYAFNKSHSFGYGLIAYQTAYLKAHHPAEYLSALLTSVKANLDKAAVYLAECRTMGIEVTVPDINRSVSDFAPVVDEETGRPVIVFGLSASATSGSGLVGLLLGERDANGPFADFYDFCQRVDYQVSTRRRFESLIKAGAFDFRRPPPAGPPPGVRVDRRRHDREAPEHDSGTFSLFDDSSDDAPMFRRAAAHRGRRVRQAAAAVEREGDARSGAP